MSAAEQVLTISGKEKKKRSGADVIFDVDPGRFKRTAFPKFREPTEIGCFSVDGERTMINDSRNVRFYCPPSTIKSTTVDGRLRPELDLSVGHSVAVRKDHGSGERLDVLLRYIVANKDKLSSTGLTTADTATRLQTDFVCYRGLLTKLICTPYEKSDGWIICATRFLGNVYLCAFDTQSEVIRRSRQSEREDLMSYWGFKFEQYVTTDEPGGVPDPDRPVNEKEEYCCVCKTKLNRHRLLFGAEVDCVMSQQRNSQSTSRYVELKTNREITTERQETNFKRFKLIKWWAQSFLVGIKLIACGFRDDDGFVRSLQMFNVKDLPKMATGHWDPCICFNFLDQFLSFITQCVSQDDPNVVYKFEWNGAGTSVHYTQLTDPHEYHILPDWYVHSLE